MKNSILYKSLMAGLFVTCAHSALAAPLPVGADDTLTATASHETIDFTGDHTLTINTNTTTITATGPGNITTTANGTGTIDMATGADLVIDGNVGTSALRLKNLTTDTSNDLIVNKNAGDVFLQKMNWDATGGTSSFTSTGGTLDIAGGDAGTADLTIAGTMSLTDTTVTLEDAALIDDAAADITLAGSTTVDQGFSVATTVTGATLTTSGTANSGAITIGDNADLTLASSADSIIGAVSLGTGAEVNIGAAADAVTLGAITTRVDGTGIANLTSAFTLDSAIGTATAELERVDVTGAITVGNGANDIYATTVNLTGAGTLEVGDGNIAANITTAGGSGVGILNFTGTGAVTGTIGATDDFASVNYNAATTALGTSIAATNITLGSAANVTASADSTLSGALAVAGSTLNLGSHAVGLTGAAAFDATSTLATTITSTADYGQLTTSAATTVNEDATVFINVADNSAIADGNPFKIIDATGGTAVDVLTAPIEDNSNLYDFTRVGNIASEDLDVTATLVASFDTDTANTALAGFGAALQDDLEAGDLSAELTSAVNNVAGLSGAALATMVPELNGAQVETTFANQNRIFDATAKRARSNKEGLWIQTSFANNDKDTTDGIDGYDADSKSITLGGDAIKAGNSKIGLAFTYTQTDIEGQGAVSGNENDVDSYNVTFYGAKKLATGATIDAQATAGTSGFDSSRNLSAIGSGIASGDYDAKTYGLNANISKDYVVKGLEVTPVAGLAYNYAEFDAYTETGSASALAVEKESFNSLKSKIGAEVAFAKQTLQQGWTVKPKVNAYWNHEFMDGSSDYTAKLVGGSTSFTTNGTELESDSISFGAGVDLVNTAGWNVGVAYDADLSSDSTNQMASLSVSKKF
ncbi:MAG: autotransporter domain-containing protein [Alphaproteobacteria bacterium]|nr:autotransporter domain-containing protein [Alphaproteobacteria bacterium]